MKIDRVTSKIVNADGLGTHGPVPDSVAQQELVDLEIALGARIEAMDPAARNDQSSTYRNLIGKLIEVQAKLDAGHR